VRQEKKTIDCKNNFVYQQDFKKHAKIEEKKKKDQLKYVAPIERIDLKCR